jgi:hypothetical protein
MARDLPAAFEDFAAWCQGTSPLYAALAGAVADDSDLLAVAEAVPEGRSAPHLLFGGVHFLLLRGADAQLAAYYPSVTEDARPVDAGLEAAFRVFVDERAAELEPILTERRTQTNAVGRCAALYPAFAHAADRFSSPPAVLDLGASAGLNLLWDRYGYDYDGRRVGRSGSPVVLECGLRGGEPPLPDEPPAVASRVGLDLNPLDPTDPDDADWLRALVWPEHADRRERLNGALEVAAADPPDVVAGDAVERLPELLEGVPRGTAVCLVITLLLYQLPEAERERFRDRVRELGADRELHWIASGGDADRDRHATGLQYGWVEAGELRRTQLGAFEAHGRWLRWEPEP